MSIESFFDTEFTIYRSEWTSDQYGDFSEEQEHGTFQGQLQQATPELAQSLGLSFTKTFIIWCPIDTDIKEGDSLYASTDNYSAKAIMKNNIGMNKHLEVVVQQEGKVRRNTSGERSAEVEGLVPEPGNDTNFPQTVAVISSQGPSSGWANIDNSKLSDEAFATASYNAGEDPATQGTNTLKVTNFGFEVPLDVNILGIEVHIEKKASHNNGGSQGVVDNSVILNKSNDTPGTQNKASASYWNTSEQTITYGADDDLWGETLTPADVNDPDFGVRVIANLKSADNTTIASIDSISITVYWE